MFLIRRIDSSNLTRRWGPHPRKTRAIPPMWEHSWASVADACPTLIPHRGNGSFTKRIVLFDTLSIGKCGFLNMCFRYHRKWIQWQDHNITVALASALMAPITSRKTLELLKMLSVDNIKSQQIKNGDVRKRLGSLFWRKEWPRKRLGLLPRRKERPTTHDRMWIYADWERASDYIRQLRQIGCKRSICQRLGPRQNARAATHCLPD